MVLIAEVMLGIAVGHQTVTTGERRGRRVLGALLAALIRRTTILGHVTWPVLRRMALFINTE